MATTLKYYWDNCKCYISRQATLSPSSYVYFDIPEGDKYNLKNITLGGSTPGTSDFGGVGLQIRKIGKGSLVMSKANPDFAGSDVVSIVVQNGTIVVATNGCFQTYDATYKPSAPGCELHVYGML